MCDYVLESSHIVSKKVNVSQAWWTLRSLAQRAKLVSFHWFTAVCDILVVKRCEQSSIQKRLRMTKNNCLFPAKTNV